MDHPTLSLTLMNLDKYLNCIGFTDSLDDLKAFIMRRDAFADSLTSANSEQAARGIQILAEFDAHIQACGIALVHQHETAVDYVRAVNDLEARSADTEYSVQFSARSFELALA